MQNSKVIHFIGIGGIGISALAYLSLAEGKKVTGSDSTASALTNDLAESGAIVHIGHNPDLIDENTELVIYTEAIDRLNNPEYLQACAMELPVLSYFEALGQLTRTKKTIAVIGTHGKTTTTAMLGLTLASAGFDPLVIVGSKVSQFGGRNIRLGGGDVFVAEACEYRRSFLNLQPFGAVFLNCEADHLDYYKDEADYQSAYIAFVESIPADGFLVANMDDKNVEALSRYCAGRIIPVTAEDADKLSIELKVMGDFNRLNAAMAYRAAEALGAEADDILKGLGEFRGTWRRQEEKGTFNGALVIDDYGHHPTELIATLSAIKSHYPDKQIICVFQPHQYSRTHLLINAFSHAFTNADKVIITTIYEARDTADDKAKVSAETLVERISLHHKDVTWGKSMDDTYKLLKKIVTADDVVVTMGAGSIGQLAERMAEGE